MRKQKENLVSDIRKFAIPSGRLITEELQTMNQCLARAADRIEELEFAIRCIKKYAHKKDFVIETCKEHENE